MKRTLDNCTFIKQNIKLGIGEPEQNKEENLCLGYATSEYDDEPCEKCKKCKLCTMSYAITDKQ